MKTKKGNIEKKVLDIAKRDGHFYSEKEIIEAFSILAKEKNIDRTNLSTIIEDIFMTLIYKKFG